MIDTEPLHPASRLEWMVEAVNYGPGEARAHCVHCGQPAPCVDAVLDHMKTDLHQSECKFIGRCVYTRQEIEEMPEL